MGKVIDYTHKRLHSKTDRGLRIEVCPKCGRKGERIVYRDGAVHYAHKGEVGMWGMISIDDHCMIPAKKE